ncbi:MAG: serine/threonine protein kinase [Isosphaera sp.]|nr:serine/threonine protein kinase [Isosphaera sp.]
MTPTATGPPPEPTAAPAPARWATTAPAGFDEEFRRLLRSRLILVHLLTLAFVALLVVLEVTIPRGDAPPEPAEGPGWRLAGSLAVSFAESLVGTLVLWRRPGMSARSLRVWELALFGTQTAYHGHFRFEVLAHTAGTTEAVGFAGLSSLQGFITLVLAYGVLVPNTRRRSLTVVAALAAVAFAVIPAAAAVNPVLWQGHVPALAVQAALILAVPAAVAVFVAARTTALQRRAFEAERRAEEVGQYALKRKLGEGGMGEVYLAEHRLLKRPCAVKFVRPELASHPATAARFEREVRAVTGLTHFHTVRVYDYGRADDGSFYYVMEYLDGPTLDRLVRDAGPLDPGRVVYLARQLCGALAEAHAAGLVHRDLKPGNVIVAALGGQHDVAKLLDFGLVQDLGAEDGRLTRTGTVLGTPAYMCPEQAGGSPVDARGDIYSLGAVAFFALTGRPPFEATTVGGYLTAHLTKPAPDVSAVRADVPADLAAVVARCLAKDPAGRFQTVADLERALAGCGCAADWGAARAAGWWGTRRTAGE